MFGVRGFSPGVLETVCLENGIAETERGQSRRDAGFESAADLGAFTVCVHFDSLQRRFVDERLGQNNSGRDFFVLADASD